MALVFCRRSAVGGLSERPKEARVDDEGLRAIFGGKYSLSLH